MWTQQSDGQRRRRWSGGRGLGSLQGKVAVVTGAASGIGRALAEVLSERSCHLALVDRDRAGLEALQGRLQAVTSVRISCHIADVGDRARMGNLPEEVRALHGGAQLLVNCAGVAYEGAFVRTSLDAWQQVLSANLWGTIHACHFFLPLLARSPQGHIVNLSSLLGITGMPGQTAYCASKFAIRGLSEALAEELRPTNVGLTLVHPGAVATNIMRTATGDDPELLARLHRWYERHAMAPAIVARRIATAVERGRARLLIAPETTLGDWLRRCMPVTGNRVMADLAIALLGEGAMRRKRMEQWQQIQLEDEPTA